jgi:hypothetical protein
LNWAASGFRDTIDALWSIKQRELIREIDRFGRPPKPLDKKRRDELISRAVEYAFEALQPLARKEFDQLVCDKINRRPLPSFGSRGPLDWETVESFLGGLSKLDSSNHVYIFWNGSKCIYVGQSKKGHWGGGNKWDPQNWRDSSEYQVFATNHYRDLSKFECLAIDIFKPLNNKNKAPDQKFGSKCPVHESVSYLEGELLDLFSLRG